MRRNQKARFGRTSSSTTKTRSSSTTTKRQFPATWTRTHVHLIRIVLTEKNQQMIFKVRRQSVLRAAAQERNQGGKSLIGRNRTSVARRLLQSNMTSHHIDWSLRSRSHRLFLGRPMIMFRIRANSPSRYRR